MSLNFTRQQEVFDFKKTPDCPKSILYGCYPHIEGDKFYWQSRIPGKRTKIDCVVKGENGFEESGDIHTCLSDSLAAQNFRVFIDTRPDAPEDERYKAIGGYHVGRGAIKGNNITAERIARSPLHQELIGCEISGDLEIVLLQDQVWPEETRLLFKDDFCHPRHANGFYIFKSPDGLRWDLYHDKPVISTFSGIEGFQMASDNMPSIFYDHNIDEYVAYLRCNIRLGVRHVFYTKSKDLINWDEPQLIKKDPKFDFEHENLYYMAAYPYPNSKKYIAFSPHFKNDILTKDGSQRRYYDTKTLVMVSDDRLNWRVVDEIFSDQSNGHMTQRHVISFRKEGEVYGIYVHEGFLTKENKVVRYTVDKKELDSCII